MLKMQCMRHFDLYPFSVFRTVPRFSVQKPILYIFKNSEKFTDYSRLNKDHFSFPDLFLINSRFFSIKAAKQFSFSIPDFTIFGSVNFNLRYLLNRKSKFYPFYVHG